MDAARALDPSTPLRPAVVPAPAGDARSWYALRTLSRHEKKVRARLIEGGFETFLPVYVRWSRWRDRRARVEFPLFPGYCFVRCLVADRVRILNIPGIAGFVGPGGRPEAVPDVELDQIRRLIASQYRYDPHPYLHEGDEVEVIRGPLAGVRGRLVRKDRSTRLVIAVTLIRQAASLEIHPADVAPV